MCEHYDESVPKSVSYHCKIMWLHSHASYNHRGWNIKYEIWCERQRVSNLCGFCNTIICHSNKTQWNLKLEWEKMKSTIQAPPTKSVFKHSPHTHMHIHTKATRYVNWMLSHANYFLVIKNQQRLFGKSATLVGFTVSERGREHLKG